jgi:hypothetical protein
LYCRHARGIGGGSAKQRSAESSKRQRKKKATRAIYAAIEHLGQVEGVADKKALAKL